MAIEPTITVDVEVNLTPSELDVVQALASVANAFAELERYHPSEMEEFVLAIHQAQHIVMARVAIRAHPRVFHRQKGS